MVDSRENKLIERLDEIAQEFNSVDFGLPWADEPLEAMQEAIKAYGQASREAAIEECAAEVEGHKPAFRNGRLCEMAAESLRALKGKE